MKSLSARLAFIAIFVLLLTLNSLAQSNSSDATISGELTDISGNPINNVHVRVFAQGVDSAVPAQHTAISSANGSYSLALPAGSYRIYFEHPAFTSREVAVQLAAGENRKLDMRLEIAPLSDNVVVTANLLPDRKSVV